MITTTPADRIITLDVDRVGAPYNYGDKVQVLVTWPDGSSAWVDATVLDCHRPHTTMAFPKPVDRWRVTTILAWTLHGSYLNDRVYCDSLGQGDEIRARVEDTPLPFPTPEALVPYPSELN